MNPTFSREAAELMQTGVFKEINGQARLTLLAAIERADSIDDLPDDYKILFQKARDIIKTRSGSKKSHAFRRIVHQD